MQTCDETRRYTAKASLIGIIAATLFAAICGAAHYIPMRELYEGLMGNGYLLVGQQNMLTEITVAAAGILALAFCGITRLLLRNNPAKAQACCIGAGKALLLAAPIGYIQSLLGQNSMTVYDGGMSRSFLFSFAALATLFVGGVLGSWGLLTPASTPPASQGSPKSRPRRFLRNTAILLGIMTATVLVLIGRTWQHYGDLYANMSMDIRLTVLVREPLHMAFPAVVTVTLLYLLLSVPRWDDRPHDRLFGRGSTVFLWLTLAISALSTAVTTLFQVQMIKASAVALMLSTLANWYNWLSLLSSLVSLWALGLLLSVSRTSRVAVWGIRGILAVSVLRHLLPPVTAFRYISFRLDASSLEAYTRWSRLESWITILCTFLTAAALFLMARGLIRHVGVGKSFWTVPVLTVVVAVIPLLVGILWELLMRNMNTEGSQWFSVVSTVTLPAVISLIRALVGIRALTRTPAPADRIIPPPATPDGKEPPKPRVEDYLYQL